MAKISNSNDSSKTNDTIDSALIRLINETSKIFSKEPAVLHITCPELIVVGDIHGNIDSLLRIFERNGYPPLKSYLFLGDLVDRGSNSIEVILLLYALKFLFPDNLYILRGNHEECEMTDHYGFKNEVYRRLNCDESIINDSSLGCAFYFKVVSSFNTLPIAAIVNSEYFAIHGGITPQLKSLGQITKDIDHNQITRDILWSDPSEEVYDYDENPRGCGFLFGEDAAIDFLNRFKLKRIIRAHQTCFEGIDFPFGSNGPVITVFSSCDYCDQMNQAAFLIIKNQANSQSDDEDFEIKYINPLFMSQMKKRRVIYPDWLFAEQSPAMMPIPDSLFDFNPMIIENATQLILV